MAEKEKYLPYLAGVGMSLIFGFSFLFTKEALSGIGPFHLLGFRFGIAALTLSLLKIFKIINVDYRGKGLHKLIAIALAQPVTYFIFEVFGIKMTTASESGMMIALIPVVVTVFAAIFLKEYPSKIQIIFVGLSVVGTIFIIIMKSSEIGSNISGIIVLLMAVLCASIFNILSRKYSAEFKPVEITFAMMWIGAIAFNFIAVLEHLLKGEITRYFEPLLNYKVLSSILYLGILSSVIAFFLVNYTLSKLEASRSAVFANLSSVVSIIAGVLIRHEPFYWYQFVGAVMILTGVWGTNYFGSKFHKKAL
ncbi:Permease of the drug/metabolite transporter (DMT) superfamily [Caminicella sporogenes DSM 14501]|uniref:Permease of the drug/metabolite transporter (DMT) superfamily n=1 Tax=Caminicella sporogenes DSM 14501 TaxID=1121266 RepID=A0A1M6N4N2_9FIRM|nr:DMT family transporter [Caminicella sporogenes]RKD22364.1 permease [Caminicella sporogenes]WIF95184.1 DMT family transporter [Caminicella sporogenes]SHJ90650.1 Permease of the drug/metabolite transporter (DMT) superfamily [Caminicella sporogenes DSM 14501]